MRGSRGGPFEGRRSTVLFVGLASLLTGYILEVDALLAFGVVTVLAVAMVWDEIRRVGRWLHDLRMRAEVFALKLRNDRTTVREEVAARIPLGSDPSESEDPMADLRERYADGEITHEEYERLVAVRMAEREEETERELETEFER